MTDTTATVADADDSLAVLAAFSPGGLTTWQAWNATNTEIDQWSNAGFSAAEAAWWLAWRPDITPAVSAELLNTPSEQFPVDWVESPIPTGMLIRWADLGLDLDEIIPWATDEQFAAKPRETAHLLTDGFACPAEYRHWSSIDEHDPATTMRRAWGQDPPAGPPANLPVHCSWDNPAAVRAAGLWLPAEYRHWRLVSTDTEDHSLEAAVYGDSEDYDHDGAFPNDSITAARAAGITAEQLKAWTVSIDDVDVMLRAVDVSSTGSAAADWLALFGDLDVTATRVRGWNDQWWSWEDDDDWMIMNDWFTRRVAPEVARRWHDRCDTPALTRFAGPYWHRFGFDPDTDRDWVVAVADSQVVHHAGITTVPAAALMKRRGCPPDPSIIQTLALGVPRYLLR